MPHPGEVILGLELFLDRWLISIYADGLVYLWDTDADITSLLDSLCAVLHRNTDHWSSFAASIQDSGDSIILALASEPPLVSIVSNSMFTNHISRDARIFIYNIRLSNPSTFDLIMELEGRPLLLRHVDPNRHVLSFSRGCDVELIDWGLGQDRQLDISEIGTADDDMSHMVPPSVSPKPPC